MAVDAIVSVVALALVALIGANTWLLLSVRDKIGGVDRRVEAQGHRLPKLIEGVEGQGNKRRAK